LPKAIGWPELESKKENIHLRLAPRSIRSILPMQSCCRNGLSQLGFFTGRPNGVLGLASRAALRDFKAMNSLAADDQWNSETELALNADRVTRASETFIGGWGDDPTDCGPTQPGGARLRINIRQAEIENVICKFGAIAREADGWRVAADCSKPGKRWKSDVKIEVSADRPYLVEQW